MEWYVPYKEELTAAFNDATRLISTFPPPLNHRGLLYINKFNPAMEDSTNNYISYLLPFWLQDLCPVTAVQLRQLTSANILHMLYYFIIDDRMDRASSPHTSQREELAFAHLCCSESLRIYQRLFPADSPFWTAYQQYSRVWADAVTNEPHANYFIHERTGIASKSAPVKLASTGVLCLGEKIELIPAVSQAVDHVLIILQMVDDWLDWKVDLAEENYNSLLAWTRSELGHPADYPLTADEIWHALTVKNMFASYIDQTQQTMQPLLELADHIPMLQLFHQYLLDLLIKEGKRIEEGKKMLKLGGLFYLLANK